MKFLLTKQDLFSFVLFFILVCLLVFWPVLLAPYNVKYLSFLYFIIGIIFLPILKIPYSFIKRTRVFFFLLIINFIALVVHFTDSKTVVNISALVFSYFALYLLVMGGVRYLGYQNFEETVFKYFIYILLISLFISPILTYLKWPYAPDYYPWEALVSSKRLLLVIGKNVGHSDSMWLMAFGAAFIMKKIFFLNQKKIMNIVILLLLIWGLMETGSRTALLFIIILSIALASYNGLFPRRLFVLVPVIGAFLFYFSIVKPD
jgi:hypothetical protein